MANEVAFLVEGVRCHACLPDLPPGILS
jgi:hypothetical protein